MQQPQIHLHIKNNELCLFLSGDWTLSTPVPKREQILSLLAEHPDISHISFDCSQLNTWDSSLVSFIYHLQLHLGQVLDLSSLPHGVHHLLQLAASSAQETTTSSQISTTRSVPARLEVAAQSWMQEIVEFIDFIGLALLSFLRLLRAQSVFRFQDLVYQLHFCGAQALPIVSLISLLVGLILAFVGAVQLQYFGAQIYVADLVGIAMTREMGAMMTGIIMAGRTGAAFAAQLGTMQVNEEIDALHTLGISSFDFLVLPRTLALLAMMPLLCLYADLVGILGGAIVGLGMLDISLPLYWNQTVASITLPYVWLGVIKSCVFGFIVAEVGCLRGMQAGRSAESVGQAATSAVVTIIVGIIVIDGLFAVICNIIGI
jgi:phospholipid/cholesterol/gamma-HCH transport system permease protein